MTVEEYKKHKSLEKENLRDHMDDMEIILTMLGEAATTRLTKERDTDRFKELKEDANDGGTIAGNTRKDIESKLGKSVITKDNYLDMPEKQKRFERRRKDNMNNLT